MFCNPRLGGFWLQPDIQERDERRTPATSSGAAPGSETPSDEASEGSVPGEELRDLQEAEEEVNCLA